MCQRCERKIHDASSQHRKRAISSFMGCPSAKDFAELWGFNLNELAGSAPLHRFVQTTGCSVDPNGLNEDIQGKSNYEVTGPAAASQLSLARGYKIVSSGQQLEMHKSSFILQQLLDLGRLQLSDKNNLSLFLRCQEQDDTMSSTYRTSSILDEKFYPNLQLKEPRPEPLSFTHSENFPSFSSLGFPLLGDSFWQCKSPDDSSQLWSQNMQDIGVCEEPIFHDSLNIPDVDLTFLNIEEMLDGVKDANKGLTNYEDESFFQMGYRMNLDRAANSCTKDFEVTDPSDKVYLLQSKRDSSRRIQQSFSFSLSRLSAESSDTECHDTGVSANTAGGEPLCNSPDFDGEQINCGENPMTGHREKKARL